VRGTIFSHNEFKFHDGATGKKLLILLNSPQTDEPYLLVTTTSKTKPYIPTVTIRTCLHRHKRFFIPANEHFFHVDTWVNLYPIYPFSGPEILKDRFANKATIVGKLETQLVNEIVNCLIRNTREDILPKYIVLLQRDKAH
jgi:hypothetical protein